MTIGASSGQDAKLSWESFKQQFQLKTDAYFRFGEAVQEREIGENLKIKVSDLEECRFSFDADVLSEMILRAEAHGEFSVGFDMLKFGKFGPALFTFMAPVGIPVIFTLSAEMMSDLSLQGEMDKVATGGVTLTGGLTLGIEYDGSEWKPLGDARYDYTPHPLELRDENKLEVEVAAYPKISMKLYDFLGPYFSPKAYVNDKLASGYLFGSAGDDYCAWTEEVSIGVKPEVGLGVEFLGLEGSMSLPMDPWAEAQLYNAPDTMTLVSPASGTKVEVGQPVAVRFNVTRKLVGVDLPATGVVVKFVSDGGTVDHELAITGPLGNADVQWTPQEQGASLRAEVYNTDGKVILEETFTPETEWSIIGKWKERSGMLKVEPPHEFLQFDNCLEFREDGTFSYVWDNPDMTPAYTEVYNENWEQIGYIIGLFHKEAAGTYAYADSEITITSCDYYIETTNGTFYNFDGQTAPEIWYSNEPEDAQNQLGGKVQFLNENCIKIGTTTCDRILEEGTEVVTSKSTSVSGCAYRYVKGKGLFLYDVPPK